MKAVLRWRKIHEVASILTRAVGLQRNERYWELKERFGHDRGAVGFTHIGDEDLKTLTVDDIVLIYRSSLLTERWGDGYSGLYNHPFFIKSLQRLKELLDSETGESH